MAKIGLYLCECGPNIKEAIDLDRIGAAIESEGRVFAIERHRLLCSEEGKKFLVETIKKHGFDRIVIAACSPKQHEATFMAALSEGDLNPYLFQLVNIREQCAWMTPDKEAATDKALRLIRAAISRVRYHQPLERKSIECNPDVIIIGGGIAGIEAGLRVAKGRKVYIIDNKELGGMTRKLRHLFPTMADGKEMIESQIEHLRSNDRIELWEGTTVKEILGFFGNFIVTVVRDGEERRLSGGAIVLATGCRPHRPKDLPSHPNLYTAWDFESLPEPPEAKTVAIIHCFDRKKLGYCSRICCVNSMKIAQMIKKRSPQTRVIQFYKNLCLPDPAYERFYHQTRELGIEFIRYQKIEISDRGIGYHSGDQHHQLDADLVILATGLVPNPENERLARMLNIPLDEYGFFKEEHIKLAPIGTVTEGVFVVGGAHGPGSIADASVQAGAAAGRILSALVPGRRLELEAKTSAVRDSLCIGCGVCVQVCAYGAVTIDESRRISVVNEVLCRGCGNCAAACPSGAVSYTHLTLPTKA